MTPENLPLLYPLDSIDNLRDLGGRPAFQGRPIKKGLLFRSAELSGASPRDLRYLEDLGMGLVIDFRDLDEREARPDRLPQGAEYHHLPALPLRWAREDVPDSPLLPQLWQGDKHRFFLVFYRVLARSEETAAAYASFFRLLLQAPARPVLFHCTQGKDRTGLAAILLQTALGLSWEDCLVDYFLTNEMIRPRLEQELAACESPDQAEEIKYRELVQADCIAAWRESLDEKWGGLEQYLQTALGLDGRSREDLRRLYLE